MYVDAVLPFGLRSAPKLFTALADGLAWMAKEHGVVYYFHHVVQRIQTSFANTPGH